MRGFSPSPFREARSAATPINPLVPATAEDASVFAALETEALASKAARSALSAEDALRAASARATAQRALLGEAATHLSMPSLAPASSMLTRDTRTHNALICQPQQRNTAGRIFGGFLMRRAFDLAFANAYLFAGTRPRFRQVEHVSFTAPVEVGALLRLEAAVVLTQPAVSATQPEALVTVDVEAVVAQPELRRSVPSNTFTFTFAIDEADLARTGGAIRTVLPADLEEAQRQLEVTGLVGQHAHPPVPG